MPNNASFAFWLSASPGFWNDPACRKMLSLPAASLSLPFASGAAASIFASALPGRMS